MSHYNLDGNDIEAGRMLSGEEPVECHFEGRNLGDYERVDYGMIVAWARDSESGLFGFIAPDGEWVVKPTFAMAPGDFHEGLAVFKEPGYMRLDGYCGFIDTSGEIVIPPKYQYLDGRSYFSQGLAAVGEDGTPYAGYIDKDGEWAIAPDFYNPLPFLGAYTPAGDKETVFGIIDKGGNWHVAPRFAWLGNFYDGLACGDEHMSDDNWNPRRGYVNESGEIVIEPNYGDWPEFDSFSEGRAKLTDRRTNLSIYIDRYGFPVGYTEVLSGGYFSEGLAQATDPYTNRAGFLGLDGNWAISPTFYFVHDFHDGLAAAVESGNSTSSRQVIGGQAYLTTVAGMAGPLWGFIDKHGEWAIRPAYAGMRYFGAGFAAVQDMETQKWGVIDKEGRWMAKPRFENIGHFHIAEE